MSDEQEWDRWLDEIDQKGVNLTAWETDFIEHVQAQRALKFALTLTQAEILERIFASRTP